MQINGQLRTLEFNQAVEAAKKLLKARTELKYEIVKIALKVCIIREGNNKSSREFSLTSFARKIGIPKGTLSRWKLEYENVIKKVSRVKGIQNKINSHALNQTMKKVKQGTPQREVIKIYKTYMNYDNKEDKTLTNYLDRLKTLHFFICFSADINKLNQDHVEAVKTMCEAIVKRIDNKDRKVLISKGIRDAVAQANKLLMQ